MESVDYNAVTFEQFLHITPELKVSLRVDFNEYELLLFTYPIFDGEEDEAVRQLICAYRHDGCAIIAHPIGTIHTQDCPGAETLFAEDGLATDCVCLVTGRITGADTIAFSTIAGCLSFAESQQFLPYGVQAAGEAVARKILGDREVSWARIGSRLFSTVPAKCERQGTNPFSQLELTGPLPL
jgi:hypothetical protein